MSKQKETPTITMTEEQLENIICAAVIRAIRESKAEAQLPINDKDELKGATHFFSLLGAISSMFLGILAFFSGTCIYALIKYMCQYGFQWLMAIAVFDLALIGVSALFSIKELYKNKKLEVLNTVFNAIMAISGLIVAVVGAVFAYQALK